jgi:hypothetical protein
VKTGFHLILGANIGLLTFAFAFALVIMPKPTQRFVPFGDGVLYALDTVTGKMCNPTPDADTTGVPACEELAKHDR